MADALYELLAPHMNNGSPNIPSPEDSLTTTYLNRLTALSLSSLEDSEPQALAQASHSVLRSIQALSTRSYKAIIVSADQLSSLQTTLPLLTKSTADLRDAIPRLDEEAVRFSETYNKSSENDVLDRRRKALLLARNVDKLADVLDLPSLLSTAISNSGTAVAGTRGASTTLNYGSALDLNAHIRRLGVLYPESALIASISAQADEAMQDMATDLIASLKIQGVKLPAALRTISWLRRVAPELDAAGGTMGNSREGKLGTLFLVCRLSNLVLMLDALQPLRNLADKESRPSNDNVNRAEAGSWASGQQTEKYLKRYIEIFREQSFAIISMFKSIFPTTSDNNVVFSTAVARTLQDDLLQPMPSALSTFPLHLVDMLLDTLRQYLPNVRDKSSRDSLLTQVLYCASSLGRLGGDFSMVLAFLSETEADEDNDEWVEVINKHRVLAGRLEVMVGAKDG